MIDDHFILYSRKYVFRGLCVFQAFQMWEYQELERQYPAEEHKTTTSTPKWHTYLHNAHVCLLFSRISTIRSDEFDVFRPYTISVWVALDGLMWEFREIFVLCCFFFIRTLCLVCTTWLHFYCKCTLSRLWKKKQKCIQNKWLWVVCMLFCTALHTILNFNLYLNWIELSWIDDCSVCAPHLAEITGHRLMLWFGFVCIQWAALKYSLACERECEALWVFQGTSLICIIQ